MRDADTLYQVPIALQEQHADDLVCKMVRKRKLLLTGWILLMNVIAIAMSLIMIIVINWQRKDLCSLVQAQMVA